MKNILIGCALLLTMCGIGCAGYYAGSHQYIYSTMNGTPERLDPITGRAWLAINGRWEVLRN